MHRARFQNACVGATPTGGRHTAGVEDQASASIRILVDPFRSDLRWSSFADPVRRRSSTLRAATLTMPPITDPGRRVADHLEFGGESRRKPVFSLLPVARRQLPVGGITFRDHNRLPAVTFAIQVDRRTPPLALHHSNTCVAQGPRTRERWLEQPPPAEPTWKCLHS